MASHRLGFLAHELRNLMNTAIIAFEVLKTGNVGWPEAPAKSFTAA